MFLAKMFLNPSIVSRGDWGAAPPSRKLDALKPEVTKLVITFTETDVCQTKEECVKRVKEAQTRDMEQGQSDIQYNFMVGGDGYVYEGRGWTHAPDFTSKSPDFVNLRDDSVTIAFIGNHEMKPSMAQVKAFAGIVLKGMSSNVIVKDPRKLKPCMAVNNKVVYMSQEVNEREIEKMEKSEKAGFLEKYKGLIASAAKQ